MSGLLYPVPILAQGKTRAIYDYVKENTKHGEDRTQDQERESLSCYSGDVRNNVSDITCKGRSQSQ